MPNWLHRDFEPWVDVDVDYEARDERAEDRAVEDGGSTGEVFYPAPLVDAELLTVEAVHELLREGRAA